MEKLKIYIDRLKDGHQEALVASTDPQTLGLQEERELHFPNPVEIRGNAYLADDHLIVRLSITTTATLPCSVCNESVPMLVKIENNYTTLSLSEVGSSVYDLTDEIRETILLQLPQFTECQGGSCPERARLNPFLPQDKPADATPHHFPFADL